MIRSFDGKTPKIADSAFISEAAYIVGDVEIGENSSVWPGAVIRGDFGSIIIGRNSTVEDVWSFQPATCRQDIVGYVSSRSQPVVKYDM